MILMNWREGILNLKNNNHCIFSQHKESAIEVYKNRSNRNIWTCPAWQKIFKMEIQQGRKSSQCITFLACFLCWSPYILNFIFQKSINNASILIVIFHILQYTHYKFSLYLRNKLKTDYNQYNRIHTVIIFLVFIS
jgi:hypothetical protein